MQESWPQLKSDSIPWRKTLMSSHNLQIVWPVMSALGQETKIHLTWKVGFKGTPKSQPGYLQGKYAVEITIKSVNKENSHSWVRISHGLNKLVTNLNNKDQDNNWQETSEMQFEDSELKTNVHAFASQSKAKAKPQTHSFACSSTRTFLTGERKTLDWHWTTRIFALRLFSVEETDQSSSSWWSSSKKWWKSHSGDGRKIFGTILCDLNIGLMMCGRARWQEAEATRKDFNIVLTSPGQEILNLRAFQGHSGRNLIDPSLQDYASIPNDFFQCIHHIWCAIHLHSIINSGLMLGGQNLCKRQTAFFTSVNTMNKEHRDPHNIDLEAPRLAWYKQKTWKKHQNTVYLVDTKLAQQKGFKVLSNKIERNHQKRHAPSLLCLEDDHDDDGNGRNQKRESICVTSTSSEDFLWRKLHTTCDLEKMTFTKTYHWTWRFVNQSTFHH